MVHQFGGLPLIIRIILKMNGRHVTGLQEWRVPAIIIIIKISVVFSSSRQSRKLPASSSGHTK